MTPDLDVITMPIADLKADPENARKHGDENLSAIRGSLSRFGQVKPIVATSDGVVLAGNGVLQVARELGWSEIQVVHVPDEWDEERRMAYALADNRTADLAEWDERVLAEQLLELDAVGWDLSVLGFPALMPPTDPGPSRDAAGPSEDKFLRCPSCGFVWQDVRKDQA